MAGFAPHRIVLVTRLLRACLITTKLDSVFESGFENQLLVIKRSNRNWIFSKMDAINKEFLYPLLIFLFDDKVFELGMYFPTWWENTRIDDRWKTTPLYIMDPFRCVFESVEESLETCYFVYGITFLYLFILNIETRGERHQEPISQYQNHNSSTSWYQEILNK